MNAAIQYPSLGAGCEGERARLGTTDVVGKKHAPKSFAPAGSHVVMTAARGDGLRLRAGRVDVRTRSAAGSECHQRHVERPAEERSAWLEGRTHGNQATRDVLLSKHQAEPRARREVLRQRPEKRASCAEILRRRAPATMAVIVLGAVLVLVSWSDSI